MYGSRRDQSHVTNLSEDSDEDDDCNNGKSSGSLRENLDNKPSTSAIANDKMSKEKQKFFRQSAFNSKRQKTKTLSESSSSESSDSENSDDDNDDDDSSSSGSSSSSSSDGSGSSGSGSSSSSESGSSDNDDDDDDDDDDMDGNNDRSKNDKNSSNKKKSNSSSSEMMNLRKTPFQTFAGNSKDEGSWGFAAVAAKNKINESFSKNSKTGGRGDRDKDKDKDKYRDKLSSSRTKSKDSQLSGLFDGLSHMYTTSDYSRASIKNKEKESSPVKKEKEVLKETRSSFKDNQQQQQQQNHHKHPKMKTEKPPPPEKISDTTTASTAVSVTAPNQPAQKKRVVTLTSMPLEKSKNKKVSESSDEEVPYLTSKTVIKSRKLQEKIEEGSFGEAFAEDDMDFAILSKKSNEINIFDKSNNNNNNNLKAVNPYFANQPAVSPFHHIGKLHFIILDSKIVFLVKSKKPFLSCQSNQ